MTEPESGEEVTLFPKTAGEKLREARLAQNLTLADVAARTRVPTRHLEAIEQSNFSVLPSPTYSVGFAKAYARAVGVDEVMIGRDVRGQADSRPRTPDYEPYDIAGPSRLPPRGLATVLGIVAVLVVIGFGLWFGTDWFRERVTALTTAAPEATAPAETAAPADAPAATAPATPAPTPATTGQVTLTATDVVWLKVYDGTGKTLFIGEMKPGDHFDVPPTADRPMINVGRPDKLTVTVDGSVIPPLGTGKHAIKDVEVSAAALRARANPAAAVPGASGPATGATTGNDGVAAPLVSPSRKRRAATSTGDDRPPSTGDSAPMASDTASPPASGTATPKPPLSLSLDN